MRNPRLSHAVFALLLLSSSNVLASETGPVRVVDGDTIEVNGTVFRINGIDAPEYGQTCGVSGSEWPCGKDAMALMVELVGDGDVTCEAIEPDGYGRIVGTCYVDGLDIGSEIVRQGFAWAFVRYSTVYVDVENEARLAGLRIWSGPAQPAWEYRAARWEVEQQVAPDGCPIKGNISDNGKIYHTPWSPWYSRTKIDLSKGERWFCSEADAIQAGWRAPIWH